MGSARRPRAAPALVTASMTAMMELTRTFPTAADSPAGQESSTAHWVVPASHTRGSVMGTQTVLIPVMSLAVVCVMGLHSACLGGEGGH